MSDPGVNGPSERDRLEATIESFEHACRAGRWPSIEAHLPEGPERGTVLVELVHADLEFRIKAGQPVDADAYVTRFPELRDMPGAVEALHARAAELRLRHGPPLPRTLGRFELIEEVGRGSSGVVYRARDATLRRTVALKLPRHGPAAGPDGDRLAREARHLARLRHPGIVALHEAGSIDGTYALVSEFVDGPTLAAVLARSGRLPPREAAALVLQIAEALQYAHDEGLVHRDIKPSNVLIDTDGRPRLADFGTALQQAADTTWTADGPIVGTPAYMAPEQAQGQGGRADARSDVYALGVLLYEAMTGEPPFRGSPRMVLAQVLDEEPRPPRRLVESIPRDLERIALMAMAKEPHRRYPSARALADDLRRFLDGQPVLARPVGPLGRAWRRVRRRPAASVLAVLLLSAIAAGVWQLDRARQHRRLADLLEARNVTILTIFNQILHELGANTVYPDKRGAVLDRLADLEQILDNDPRYDLRMARVYSRAGGLMNRSGRTEDARRAWTRAQHLLRKANEAAPSAFAPEQELAVIAESLASISTGSERAEHLAAAEHHRRRARMLAAAKVQREPDNDAARSALAWNAEHLGDLLRHSGRRDEAIAEFRFALKIRNQQLEANPGDARLLRFVGRDRRILAELTDSDPEMAD